MTKRNYKWVVADWSDLEATIPHAWDYMVGQEDVDRFVTEAFVLAALDTGISLDEFVEKNDEFYAQKRQVFENYEYLAEDSNELARLQMLLRVPAFSF